MSGSVWNPSGYLNTLFASAVNFLQNKVGAILRTVQSKLEDEVSIADFGASPSASAAFNRTAIQAAIDSFPKFGEPGWKPWKLNFVQGIYTIDAPLILKDAQGGAIYGNECQIEGTFDGPIMVIGGGIPEEDVLRFAMYDLTLANNATTANARALKLLGNYTCLYSHLYLYGGSYTLELDGNNNTFDTVSFRSGAIANVLFARTSNNETNVFINCASELSAGYGYAAIVAGGIGGGAKFVGGYVEANALAGFYVQNNAKLEIDSVYFNLQNSAPGILLAGTVGADYIAPHVTATNCRVLGPTSGTAYFIEEASPTSVNASYENNTLTGGNVSFYQRAYKSINKNNKGFKIYVANAQAFSGGPPPTGWTLSGAGPVAAIASISQYGAPASVQISGASYLHQTIVFPANALLKVSCWVKTSLAGGSASIQMWDAALGAMFTGAAATMSGTTPQLLEFYVPATSRASATTGKILLRNLTGVGDAIFSDLIIEDLTN